MSPIHVWAICLEEGKPSLTFRASSFNTNCYGSIYPSPQNSSQIQIPMNWRKTCKNGAHFNESLWFLGSREPPQSTSEQS
jgi:hypothetical protein